MIAAQKDHPEVIKALINSGADVNAREENGWTALMIAVQEDHPEVIKALIDGGADINARKENGWTALMIAAQKDHPKVIKALIDGGADVNLKNNDGATAQMIAANKGYFSLEKMLAESNSITEEDFKKLCHNCNATAVLESLKKKNISSCFVFENGETLLRTAIRVVSTPEIIQVLLDFGFDVNAHIDNGGTALTAAAFEGSASIIQTGRPRSAAPGQDRLRRQARLAGMGRPPGREPLHHPLPPARRTRLLRRRRLLPRHHGRRTGPDPPAPRARARRRLPDRCHGSRTRPATRVLCAQCRRGGLTNGRRRARPGARAGAVRDDGGADAAARHCRGVPHGVRADDRKIGRAHV